jgi:hypothetical protein
MAMHRTQLFLDEGQHRRLGRLAATRNRSISEIVREYVERGLQEDEKDREERRAALRRIGESRRELERLYGVYQGDLIAEIREERERDRDRVLTDASDDGRR